MNNYEEMTWALNRMTEEEKAKVLVALCGEKYDDMDFLLQLFRVAFYVMKGKLNKEGELEPYEEENRPK